MDDASADESTFGEEPVQVDGALPAGAVRPLEGVLVEPGVRLDDPRLWPGLRRVLFVMVVVLAPSLKMGHKITRL